MHKSLIGLRRGGGRRPRYIGWPGTANAGCYGCAVGAGILGGVAAGAIIGSAIANSPPPPPAATTRRRRLLIIRRLPATAARPGRPVPAMPSSRPDAIGVSVRSGSKA